MKPLYLLLTLLATISLISSCKRDKNDLPPANEGTIITKNISTDFNDKLIQRSYVRNSADKVVQYRDSSSFAYDARTFEYDANGKVSRVNLYDEYGELRAHYDLEYNDKGKVIKRVSYQDIDPQAPNISTYAYDGYGHLVADSLFVFDGAAYIPASVTKLYYIYDNVIEAHQYHSSPATGMYVAFKTMYEYDDGLNPLKQIANYYSMTSYAPSALLSRYESKNNVVKEYHSNIAFNEPYSLRFNYTYKYNSSNYPWIQTPGFDPRGWETKQVEFFYKQ